MPYTIFISTFHKIQQDERSGTGDVDYAKTLAKIINQSNIEDTTRKHSCHYIESQLFKTYSEESIYHFIEGQKANDSPILHILLNAPNVGFGFTAQGLTDFKARGGRIVMTAVEFKKHAELHLKIDTLTRLQYADSIIFLDKFDKEEAIKVAATHFQDAIFLKKLKYAAIMPVPATIQPDVLPIEKRGLNIGFFGIIRKGKGFDHILRLAILLKQSREHLLQGRKILIIGSVLEPEKLAELMTYIYHTKVTSIEKNRKDLNALKKLLKDIKELEQSGKLTPDLPVELYIDVPEPELAPLFNQCFCFFQPNYRGASYRFSSLSSLLSMGFLVYTHRSSITPEELTELRHENGMLLAPEFYYQANDAAYARFVLQNYYLDLSEFTEGATKVLVDRIPEELQIKKLSFAAQILYQEVMSPEVLAPVLHDIYERTLTKTYIKIMDIDQRTSFAQRALQQAFKNWKDSVPMLRAYKEVFKKTKIDIISQCERSLRALKDRIKNVGSQDICPKIKELIATERDKRQIGAMLTRDESYLFQIFMNYSLEAKHVTSENALDYIQKTTKHLLSPLQRTKMGQTVTAHTPPEHGLTDHLFFSVGAADPNAFTPFFLNPWDRVIKIDLDKILLDNPSALRGAWFSDHWASYLAFSPGDDFKINDVIVRLEYKETKKNKEDPKTEKIRERVIQYILPNGTVYRHTSRLGLEVFPIEKMHYAMALLAIEMVRHLGIDTYQQIMATVRKFNSNPEKCDSEREKLQQIYKIRFFPGLWELHQPRHLKIFNQPGITITQRSTCYQAPHVINSLAKQNGVEALTLSLYTKFVYTIWTSNSIKDINIKLEKPKSMTEVITALVYFLLTSDIKMDFNILKELIKVLDKKGFLNLYVQQGEADLTLFAAAMLGDRMELLQFLLSLGPHVPAQESILKFKDDTGFSPLTFAMALSDLDTVIFLYRKLGLGDHKVDYSISKNDRRRKFDKIFSILLQEDIEADDELVFEDILTKLIRVDTGKKDDAVIQLQSLQKSTIKSATMGVSKVLKVTASDINYACEILSNNSNALKFIINNYHLDPKDLSLCFGLRTKNIEIVKEMIKKGVSVNQTVNATHFSISKNFPIGFSPLLFLCQLNDIDESVLQILECLIANGADINAGYKVPEEKDKAMLEINQLEFIQSIENYSPLMMAMRCDKTELFAKLVYAGADLSYPLSQISKDINWKEVTIATLKRDFNTNIESFLQFMFQDKFKHNNINIIEKLIIENSMLSLCLISDIIRLLISNKRLSDEFLISLAKFLDTLTEIKSNLWSRTRTELQNLLYQEVTLGQVTLNIFMASILGGRPVLLQYCLQGPMHLDAENMKLIIKEETEKTELSSISLAIAVSNPSYLKEAVFSKFGSKVLTNYNVENVFQDYWYVLFKLLIIMGKKDFKVTREDIETACTVVHAVPRSIELLLKHFEGESKSLSLFFALYTRDLELVKQTWKTVSKQETFTQIGNFRLQISDSECGIKFWPVGITLLQAFCSIAADNDIELIDFLIKHCADINEVYQPSVTAERKGKFDSTDHIICTGDTAISLAIRRKLKLVTERLIIAGAKIDDMVNEVNRQQSIKRQFISHIEDSTDRFSMTEIYKKYQDSHIIITGRYDQSNFFFIFHQQDNDTPFSFLAFNSREKQKEQAFEEFNFSRLLGIDRRTVRWSELGSLGVSGNSNYTCKFYLCDIGKISHKLVSAFSLNRIIILPTFQVIVDNVEKFDNYSMCRFSKALFKKYIGNTKEFIGQTLLEDLQKDYDFCFYQLLQQKLKNMIWKLEQSCSKNWTMHGNKFQLDEIFAHYKGLDLDRIILGEELQKEDLISDREYRNSPLEHAKGMSLVWYTLYSKLSAWNQQKVDIKSARAGGWMSELPPEIIPVRKFA